MKTSINLGRVSNPAAIAHLPAVEIDAATQAMGHVPGWVAYLDPAYLSGLGALNRVGGGSVFKGTAQVGMAEFSAGLPAFLPAPLNASLGIASAMVPDVEMPRSEWTIFAVLKFHRGTGITAGLEVFYPSELVEGEVSLRLTYTVSGAIALFAATSANNRFGSSVPLGDREGATFLLMVTFSERDGLRMYFDGQLVASNAADKRPLNAKTAPGQLSIHRSRSNAQATYLAGDTGILSIDLGQAEHAGYRRDIERYLMGKYGIAA